MLSDEAKLSKLSSATIAAVTSHLIDITGQLDTDSFCFDLAQGPGRVIAVISAQANAFRKHILVSEGDASDHSAHHDAVYPYADESFNGDKTQHVVVIFVDQDDDGRRRSFQAFYTTADGTLVDPLALAATLRAVLGDAAVHVG